MPRRKTTIGRGAFGRPVNKELHERETLHRIIDGRQPLTEDAVFLLLSQVLKRNNQSTILKCVRASKNVGGHGYFEFSPDIDMLEIRKNGIIVGYELKGVRKTKQGHVPPMYYEGIDEALAYLVNPVVNPMNRSTFTGSILDYVYLVHPLQETAYHSGQDSLAKILDSFTPIGFITVDYLGTKEVIKAKRNPNVKENVKKLFLDNLDKFEAAAKYKLSLVQK